MKFYAATTKEPWTLVSIFGGGKRDFPAGTNVSATEAGPDRWHLNAEHDGETFDGYMPGDALTIGEVIATCNEGK